MSGRPCKREDIAIEGVWRDDDRADVAVVCGNPSHSDFSWQLLTGEELSLDQIEAAVVAHTQEPDR